MKRLALLAWFLVSPLQARITVNVPTGLAYYQWLDRLEAYECAQPSVRALRPQSHGDLRDTLVFKGAEDCKAPEWLMQERAILLRPALQNDAFARVFLVHGDEIPLVGIDAAVTPLYPLRDGRPFFNGPNVNLEFNANAEAGKDWGLALSATPGALFALDDYRSLDARFYLQEVYVKAGYKRAELTYGRTALRFGEAVHGDLAWSGAGRPVDLWKLALRPQLGPDTFLGDFTFETWLADQGPSRQTPNARLFGVEIGIRPFSFLELALLEVFQFGGTGIPALQASDFFQMLTYSGDPALDGKRQRSFASQLSLWAPSHTAKIYSQFFFDGLTSFSNWFNQDVSVLVGLWFPRVGEGDIRLEYASLVPGAYTHALFRGGLTYQGSAFGHPLGPDANGVYLDIGLPALGSWRPGINLTYEGRLKHPVRQLGTEWRYAIGADAERRWEHTSLRLEGKYANVYNHGYVRGLSESVVAFLGTLRYSFY